MALLEREPQLARLTDLLRATRRGHGRLVLIAGEAGIGKTTLVDAFVAPLRPGGRVIWGQCDAVVPPRPFAPLADIAAATSDAATRDLRSAIDAADRNRVFDAVLSLLRSTSRPIQILVIDDLHWADEATLDLLRIVGRRLRDLPLLVVGTYRADEVGDAHPLRMALGDLPPGSVEEIALPPLSIEAIATLAGAVRVDARAVLATTGGNPFFVTEVLSGNPSDVPATVRDAVLARVRRLPPAAQLVLRAGSVLGESFERSLLLAVADPEPGALEACLARAILRRDGELLRFRHVLAQRAIRDALDPVERQALHARALRELRSAPGAIDRDPARLVEHAVGAEDAGAILELGPAAAARAAALGAHREAAGHLQVALRFVAPSDERTRATLLQHLARAYELTDEGARAVEAQESALASWRRLGDRVHEGDALSGLANLYWAVGAGERGLQVAQAAVDLLTASAPGSLRLARALAVLAQRMMAGGTDDVAAMGLAKRASAMAEAAGDGEAIAVEALTTLGVLQIYAGHPEGWTTLEGSARRAQSAGLIELAARAWINLVQTTKDQRRFREAERYGSDAMPLLARHDRDLHRRILLGELADIALARGRWNDAERLAGESVQSPRTAPSVRARALTVLGRTAVRRGADPWPLLDRAREFASPVGADGTGIEWATLCAARAEAAWLDGDMERVHLEVVAGRALDGPWDVWWLGEFAFWDARAGHDADLTGLGETGFALHLSGRCQDAAAAWDAAGSPYLVALELSDSSDAVDLRRALEIFLELGARPMAGRVARRLAEAGVRGIPRGPRARTRANPAGLTEREEEILAFLAEGLRNAEIADRLVLSQKTVDHHVSAILRKLGVRDRAAAAAFARSRAAAGAGTPPAKDGGPAPPR